MNQAEIEELETQQYENDERKSDEIQEFPRNYSSGASLGYRKSTKRNKEEYQKFSYQPKRYRSSNRRSHEHSKLTERTDRSIFGEDSQLNSMYNRLMSASQASKIKKLIGEKNVNLDVRMLNNDYRVNF